LIGKTTDNQPDGAVIVGNQRLRVFAGRIRQELDSPQGR
jgi:hypothetical protein